MPMKPRSLACGINTGRHRRLHLAAQERRIIRRSGSAGGFAKVPERTTAARSPAYSVPPTPNALHPAVPRPASVEESPCTLARARSRESQLSSRRGSRTSTILPAIRQLKGFTGAQFLADRKSGKVVVTTFWETEQTLRDSEAKANDLRRTAADKVARQARPSSSASK